MIGQITKKIKSGFHFLGARFFSLESGQSPLFFHGLAHFLWWLANYLPGYMGITTRWGIGKLLLKKLGKYPNIRDHNIFRDGRNVEIGDFFSSGYYNYFAGGPITIGNNVRMANFVIIETTGHNFADTDKPIRQQGIYKKPVVIEDDVWIGDRVTILPGVTIGKGAVVGSGAVVPKDVPANSIVVGNPARVIGSREKSEN
jgi:maltose O-acetyltransferase